VSRKDGPPEMKLGDLMVLQGLAIREFKDLPPEVRLPGMVKPLDHGERLAVAWLRASMTYLNGAGGIREGFLQSYKQPLETPDSFPATDDPDWTQADVSKAPRRKP
jgi:hypothetical protein